MNDKDRSLIWDIITESNKVSKILDKQKEEIIQRYILSYQSSDPYILKLLNNIRQTQLDIDNYVVELKIKLKENNSE